MARITFHGACGSVTGSCTQLSWGHTQLLVDCGLYQGDETLELRNRQPFGFKPHLIAATLLTHAHLDHSGLLPRLVAEGFDGPIYCSAPTRRLARIVLEDAARLQEEEARWARKKGYSRHADPRPIFGVEEAARALARLEPVPFGEQREVAPGVRVRFRRAGHLLGAASIEVEAKGADGERRSWCFSGDVGRYDAPLLRDPEPALDAPSGLLLESTYGDRVHPEGDPAADLLAIIDRVFARGGVVVIPAFALGRTQDLLFWLDQLADAGKLDASTVVVDSPMANNTTTLYANFAHELDEELRRVDDGHPLAAGRFRAAGTVSESKAINQRQGPAIIIAGSGMANGGRVVHHLKRLLPDARNAVVFVGYQAYGTRGRALLDAPAKVAIQGDPVPVRAEILKLDGLSAHGDSRELLRWCRELPAPPRVAVLNHGEDPARKALAAAIAAELPGWPRPILPMPGDSLPW